MNKKGTRVQGNDATANGLDRVRAAALRSAYAAPGVLRCARCSVPIVLVVEHCTLCVTEICHACWLAWDATADDPMRLPGRVVLGQNGAGCQRCGRAQKRA